MKGKFRISGIVILITLSILTASFFTFAAVEKLPDGFPDKPITLVCAHGFGGGGDTFNRNIAIPAGNIAKVPINCINVTGGATTSAVAYTLNQPADGYTLIGFHLDGYALDEAYGRYKEPFLENFEPILGMVVEETQIYVRDESPFQTFEDIVSYAKLNPGKLKIAGADAGGTRELGVKQVFAAAGVDVAYVPFVGGTALIIPELLTGRIDASYDMMGGYLPLLESGQVRMLVTSGDKRLEEFPNVPTYSELGYPNFNLALTRGILARRNTPPDRITYLHDVFKEAMFTPQYQAVAKTLNYKVNYITGEEMSNQYEKLVKVMIPLLKELGYIN